YHSGYDDFYWMEHFGDPGFQYHVVISKLWGVLALRLANAQVMPFDFETYGAQVRRFVDDLDKKSRVQSHVALLPLRTKLGEFEKAGRELNTAAQSALASGKLTSAGAERLNQEIMQVESN